MRALEPEVVDVLWKSIEPLLPDRRDDHPLGCHRRRVPDRLCFWGILIRLVTGSSWGDTEAGNVKLFWPQCSSVLAPLEARVWVQLVGKDHCR